MPLIRDSLPPDLPALTSEELRDIGVRNRSPDVRDLLWEIARLRSLIRQARYFVSLVDEKHAGVPAMTQSTLRTFNAEPCVIEEIEDDYKSPFPGSRNWSGKVPSDREVRIFEDMHRGAQERIAKRHLRRRG